MFPSRLWTPSRNHCRLAASFALALLIALSPGRGAQAAIVPALLSADFDAGESPFVYVDDPFATSQPDYAGGAWAPAGGYGGSGGLQVALGGVDANAITGMSGGWSVTLDLAQAESGVLLSFRYRIDQTAAYEFDEYTRVRVLMDGVEYGRGVKTYVDHVGGDGSSGQGNSSIYLPTTNWQQAEIFLGDLAAGSHTVVLGGYNNKKDAADESSTVSIDDVLMTGGHPEPSTTAAETLAGRVSSDQFLSYLQGISQFNDRCRLAGCTDTDYLSAVDWVEQELLGMGYTTERHAFTSGGGGTNLWATKTGSVTPTEMYMVSAHLDGRGGGDAFDDDGSGVALVMEVARVLAEADVTTDKSVRFIFWDKEEAGLLGSGAYASNNAAAGGRRGLQGTLDEPTWLGLITHDMILYDHGAGSVTTQQSPYADMDVEWRAGTAQETASQALALAWSHAAGRFAPDYPATAYNYSTNTDDTPFHPYVASVSVRENRRHLTSGANAEWINPNYHTVNDVEASYTRDDDGDGRRDDIELGWNAVRTTLGLVAELAGAQIVSVNQQPVADPQTVSTSCNTPVAVTLTGSDPDNDSLTFDIVTPPLHGDFSGAAPALTYTPDLDYDGADSFTFTVNDGSVDSAPATVDITVASCAALALPFTDDFETDGGWIVNAVGTDTAVRGVWERADPQPTDNAGPKQPGVTTSGIYALVTGPLAGKNAGQHDVDGGATSIRSPALQLPASGGILLEFDYTFAHGKNATQADYLAVRVEGLSGSATVLDLRGSGKNVDAEWMHHSARLDGFAGQTIHLVVEAADFGKDSLVEAALDQVSVAAAAPSVPVLAAGFAAGAEGFSYQDDLFRGTANPDYAAGDWTTSGGRDGGALRVTLGGVDRRIIRGMSGGWEHPFTLDEPGSVSISFWFKLTQTPDYEDDELSQVVVSIDGVLYGLGANDYVAQRAGNGNGGQEEGTGWQMASVTTGPLAAGSHTLRVGAYGSRKSYTNESTEALIDDIAVTPQ